MLSFQQLSMADVRAMALATGGCVTCQIAVLQRHELLRAHVLASILVVARYALAVDRPLSFHQHLA